MMKDLKMREDHQQIMRIIHGEDGNYPHCPWQEHHNDEKPQHAALQLIPKCTVLVIGWWLCWVVN